MEINTQEVICLVKGSLLEVLRDCYFALRRCPQLAPSISYLTGRGARFDAPSPATVDFTAQVCVGAGDRCGPGPGVLGSP